LEEGRDILDFVLGELDEVTIAILKD